MVLPVHCILLVWDHNGDRRRPGLAERRLSAQRWALTWHLAAVIHLLDSQDNWDGSQTNISALFNTWGDHRVWRSAVGGEFHVGSLIEIKNKRRNFQLARAWESALVFFLFFLNPLYIPLSSVFFYFLKHFDLNRNLNNNHLPCMFNVCVIFFCLLDKVLVLFMRCFLHLFFFVNICFIPCVVAPGAFGRICRVANFESAVTKAYELLPAARWVMMLMILMIYVTW